VPLAPAYSAREIAESPQLTLRDYFVLIDHPEIEPARSSAASGSTSLSRLALTRVS